MLYSSFYVVSSAARAQFLKNPEKKVVSLNPLLTSYRILQRPTSTHDTVPLELGNPDEVPGHKSGFLAAMLSLAIPGLGEYYVGESMWRGMIFTGIEAGLWIEMFHYQSLYNNKQNAFYAYSDQHFCVAKYGGHIDTVLSSDSVAPSVHVLSCDWRTVSRDDWNSINRGEASMDSLSNTHSDLGDWNHRLINPNDDLQQYYEEISKYDQFLSGWDALTTYNTASFMRADAQNQAGIANDFLFGIFLNHVLSAIDAALLARDHNSALRVHGDILSHSNSHGEMGFIPTAKIEYRF